VTWATPGFNDSSWSNGPALLGYGDADLTTFISFGPDANNKFRTSYYRHTFSISNRAQLTAAAFELLRDDGALVYLNGTEIYRQNMPAGAVSHNTFSSESGSDDEYTYFKVYLDPASILDTNVVAVEVHQHMPDTSDARFDFAFLTRTNCEALVENQYVSGVTTTSGNVRVSLVSTGGLSTSLTLFQGPQNGGTTPGAWASESSLGLQATGAVTAVVSELSPGTRTYFRFRASNACGDVWASASGQIVTQPSLETLVPAGSVWRYLDDGSDQGSAWRTNGFDDSTWNAGPAQLGYGDGDEQTTNSYGGNPLLKFVTTYYRGIFFVTNPASVASLELGLLRDDGAVVYLNGQEIARDNMSGGAITYTTMATGHAGGVDEDTFFKREVPSWLIPGTNQLAVEIHQDDLDSSDISFDLELVALGTAFPLVTRGPYLQRGTPHAVTIRWRTDAPTNSVVEWGEAPGALTESMLVSGARTNHSVTISNLTHSTRYGYAIGTSSETLAGGDDEYGFVTAPIPGTPLPTRIWAIGDSGTADSAARAVWESYERSAADDETHVWLLLGDNAYPSGTDAQQQAAIFDMYTGLLPRSVMWPTLGNHETDNGQTFSATQTGPYYDTFSPPRNAEAGGLASGTEAYYSFDYANIHFVCLNSMDVDRSPGGTMMTWLSNDLAVAQQEWLIAFWHHPTYTKGTHDSDDVVDSSGRMRDMRETALPLLESYGVDFILCGHSHVYERSYYLNGHYGFSGSLDTNTMFVDGGDGRLDGDGAYGHTATGTAYVVCGSSGQLGGGSLDHPVMYLSVSLNGSLVFDIEGRRATMRFLDAIGKERDHFTIEHGDARGANTDGDILPDWWEQWYFGNLLRDGTLDKDLDGVLDYDELIAGSDPNDSNSFLRIDNIDLSSAEGAARLTWPGEPGRRYVVRTSTNLLDSGEWVTTDETNMPMVRGDVTVDIPIPVAKQSYYSIDAALIDAEL
jgi:hypothetical protein